ncbi:MULTISPECIES: helix-turn-helix domain-containing protein [unclassified Streptomyces]|uniref:helix-turn-helix domain-containing protein n=1 Tax=unclassified Streptomyces TaxID=2593676 RepID=UPI00136EF5F9|nr:MULTISPECIES: helix-turn-helix domain-containing protein [unclassified Streptomyces]NDZ99406.1 AraC family transcriptional regulator [Streptomyces sp. SID10116]MYY85859.1 helix-turn-helix domain-containing protein [Streptomyces sp. SID335]MYZ16660.1 helix-turn-helix domain-containing protein [Streptomyces sp. SID337]NDZ88739.1 AraC family transcriptional regulator [Streptomyces sp. SID10115]NEB45786.1 AraC family transcriptional regulator [Streptomyces sp. SID339]
MPDAPAAGDGPRRDTRGIVDASGLLSRVRFRRHVAAAPLRPYVEHYWLIDWDLPEPYATHVVPHPSVNIVFQRYATEALETACGETTLGETAFGEVAGVGLSLFTQKLEGRGRVCGVQFRPGGFRPFAPDRPLSDLTGRRLPLDDVFPHTVKQAAEAVTAVLSPADEHARVAALDAFLLNLAPTRDPQADLAATLVDRIRGDRSIRRVDAFAREEGMSVRALQRLFSAYVGVGPKWIILRYRIHEALERAESERDVDWADLAATLGYADQAHLVRDFTTTVGVPPTAYAPH